MWIGSFKLAYRFLWLYVLFVFFFFFAMITVLE